VLGGKLDSIPFGSFHLGVILVLGFVGLHRAIDLHGRAGVSLGAVLDGATRARAIFWRVVRAARRWRDRALPAGVGIPARQRYYLVRWRSWRQIGAFVPVLFGKETVGQLETVSEGVPELP
jgi:hypothetical protein